MLLDLHTGFSQGGLVPPSLEEFSMVCCDPHSQRLWCSQWSRSRCFLKFPCFFYDPGDVGNLISGSSAFSESSLCLWKFLVRVLLKPSWRILNITLLACEMKHCTVVWTFFGIALLWNWNENWPFPVCWPCLNSGFISPRELVVKHLPEHHWW